MMLTILFLNFLLAAGKPVAYIDLSQPEPISHAAASVSMRGGGALGHSGGSNLGLLGLNLKVTRFVASTDGSPLKEAVEAEITNNSATPISVPIGTDTKSILSARLKKRRYLLFQVRLGDEWHDIVGTARAASANERTQSALILKPGQSIVVKLPFDKHLAAQRISESGASSGRIMITATLFGMEVEGDTDFSEQLAQPVTSENGLIWSATAE